MKLSNQGLHTILCLEETTKGLANHEFTQNDFEGAVVLTVDEVKHLNRAITKMMAHIDIRKFDGFLYEEASILSDLDNRIEQAEKH